MLDRIVDERWLTAQRRRGPVPGQQRGRRHRGLPRRGPRRAAHGAAPAAPAGAAPRGRAQPVARRLRGPEGAPASRTTSARSPSPPGSARPDRVEAFRKDARRLQRDPAGGPRRPARRGVRRAAARAGPPRALGLRARRAARQRRPDQGAVRRHPARRPGYPACPEHTEKQSLWSLLDVEAAHRHRAHRVDGHVAGRVGVRPLLQPPASRSTSWSAGSAATRSQDYAARKGWTLAEAERWLSPTSATTRRTDRVRRTRPSSGTWTAPSSTPSPTGSDRVGARRAATAGPGPSEHSLNLVGNDLLDSGRYIREHMGIDLEPAEIVEQLLDGVIEQIRVAVPWRPGAVEPARRPARRGRAVRAGDDVLPAVRRPDPRRAARGHLRRRGDRRRGRAGEAAPRPVPQGRRGSSASTRPTAWRSRTPTPAPGRPRRRAVPCCACPNHVPVLDGERRVFADSLVGLRAANLPVLA